jgi:VWFA-related protein
MSVRHLTLAAGLIAMTASAPAAQQPGTSQPQRPRFGTSTAAVVVDVIVRDRDGNPVVDLTRDDFEVFENGMPQRLVDFERVLPGSVAQAPESATSNRTADAAAPVTDVSASGLRGQAVTAIVFDWLSEQPRYEAWKAASTLLGQMHADDFASVYVIDQALRRIVPYTRDTAALKMAFDYAVTRSRDMPRPPRGAAADALVTPTDTPLTPGAEEGAPGLVTPANVPAGAGAALAEMLQRMESWERYMDQQQQGIAVARSLLGLVEQMSGMPGRKTVVLFSEGLQISERVKHQFDLLEERANRHNVTFYTVDAAGLRVHSRMPLTAAAIGEAGEQNFSRGVADDFISRRTEALWRDPSAGLEPLAERTGGLYIGDTNDLAGGFARINADRRFHYLLAYASTNPALDGSFRKIDVRVARPGVKIRARGGYVASPSIERTERRDYESAAIAALSLSPSPSAFPFQTRALSTPLRGQPGLTSLVAAVETAVLTFREDAARGAYEGEVTVLARVVSRSGEALATQSQLYDMHGEVAKLEAVKQGRLLFFRTPEVPPGTHTVEWVVRDGTSGDAGVLRSPVEVPLPDVSPVVGDLVIVDRAEKAPDDPAIERHPLAWNGMLLYPSLGLPISAASRRELTFFLPMLVEPGDPPPATTIELIHGGRSLGSIEVPAAPVVDGSLRQVGTLPIDKLPPGVYELKASVRAGDRVVTRSATFTLVS